MISVGVNPPKTPVTEGSIDMAPATLPNVCKMPGPPAPFVPTPLPNFGRSADRLNDGTTTVKIEGKKIAIKGSYYMSQPSPDVASKGTGGGIVSSSTQGKTEFVAPGSMNVKAEGKNIQLLGDAMTNNGGSPTNAVTLPGNQQAPNPVGKAVNFDKEYLCMIFCDCLKAWKADTMNRDAARLASQVAPHLEPGFQPKRLDRQECVEKELQGNPLYKPELKYTIDGKNRFIDVTVFDAVTGKIKSLVEMKFPGDEWQPGQKEAYKKIAKREGAKLCLLNGRNCKCKK